MTLVKYITVYSSQTILLATLYYDTIPSIALYNWLGQRMVRSFAKPFSCLFERHLRLVRDTTDIFVPRGKENI